VGGEGRVGEGEMICRTCKGTGKTNHYKASKNVFSVEGVLDEFIGKVLASGTSTGVVEKKTCRDCYGSGHVLNKGEKVEAGGAETRKFSGGQLNEGRR